MDFPEPILYLASQSPRRRELLAQIGVPHQVISAPVVEVPKHGESPRNYVQRLACEKAQAGVLAIKNNGLPIRPILAADTIVVSRDLILEKPRDAAHAAMMLRQLSDSTHQVMTAVALATARQIEVGISITEVDFRALSDTEIASYWCTGEPQDKAGGYAIQGLGAVFVRQIRGSYSGVVGLPIEQTILLLQKCGLPWWQKVE